MTGPANEKGEKVILAEI